MNLFTERNRAARRALVLLVVSIWTISQAAGQNRGTVGPDLVVINMADTHSAYDAYPRILSGSAAVAEEYGGVEVVFLFNGDLFERGNAAARKSAGRADWEFLRRLGAYGEVVINVGNHEFDFVTPDEFKAYETIAYAKGFLMVSSSPLTRSSHHAGDDFAKLKAARLASRGF